MCGGGGSAMLVIAVVLCGRSCGVASSEGSSAGSVGPAAGALSARLQAVVLAQRGVMFPASLSAARVGERDLCSLRPVVLAWSVGSTGGGPWVGACAA